MTAGTVFAILLAAAAVAFVLAPLFRSDAAMEERRARNLSEEEALAGEREMTIAALKDLEDDRATGKIGEDDYATARAQLTERAIDLMKRLDALQEHRMHPKPAPVPDLPGRDGR